MHVPTAELQPLADDAMAEAAVDGLPATLGAPPGAWVATCAALHLTRQLAVHHAAILQPTLPEVCTIRIRGLSPLVLHPLQQQAERTTDSVGVSHWVISALPPAECTSTSFACPPSLSPSSDTLAWFVVTSLLSSNVAAVVCCRRWLHLERTILELLMPAATRGRSQVAKAVLGTVKNLRSAVQKSALLCLCDLLDTYADQLLPVLAGPQGGAPAAAPIQQVLLKASQDKRFVADEAQRALRTMAEKCAPALAQALLIPLAAHKNPKVCE